MLEGAYLWLFQPAGDLIQQLYAVRHLNVVLATLSAVLIFLIARAIGGWRAGVIAAGLFALDPFIFRMNSRNLLETAALWWVLLGYWLLLATLREDGSPLSWWRFLAKRYRFAAQVYHRMGQLADEAAQTPQAIPVWLAIGAGIAFGLALLTKDMTAFLTLLPLGMIGVLGWSIRRRSVALISAVTCVTYAIYPLTVFVTGDGDRFVQQKLRGLLRLIGTVKETGLNRATGPSFLDTVMAKLDQFGTTYAIIACGLVDIGLLLLFGGRASRLLAALTASAYALLGYCILFGTLEEQFFYFLVIPSLLAATVGVTLFFRSGIVRGQLRETTRIAAIVALSIFLGWSGYHWIATHFTPNNGYEQLIAYVERNVPAQERIAATSETAQFLLGKQASGPWGSWDSPDDLAGYHPDYLVISASQLAWDHGPGASALQEWADQHGEEVFVFNGPSEGALVLYRLDASASAVDSDVPSR